VNALRQHQRPSVLLKIAGLARSTFYYQVTASKAKDRHGELKARIPISLPSTRADMVIAGSLWHYARAEPGKSQDRTTADGGVATEVTRATQAIPLVSREVGRVAPNLLQRQFAATRPNEKWVTDVTVQRRRQEALSLARAGSV